MPIFFSMQRTPPSLLPLCEGTLANRVSTVTRFLFSPFISIAMTTQIAIHSSAKLSDTVIASYVSDLEDAELLTRPGAGCNHLAWQLGHLISSEVQLLESIAPGKGIALPDGFNTAHAKAANGVDDADAFLSKQEYLDLYSDVRGASAVALDNATKAELDEDAPETFRAFCPTVLDMYVLIAAHPMMHAGQFAVVRRQLGKPVLM